MASSMRKSKVPEINGLFNKDLLENEQEEMAMSRLKTDNNSKQTSEERLTNLT